MIVPTYFIFCYLCFFVFCVWGQQQRSSNFRRGSRSRLNQTTLSTENLTKSADILKENDDLQVNSMLEMLMKINDKLTSMSTISDYQSRKLDNLDYRLTKLEVQIQEKTDGLRSDLKQVARCSQELDWQSSKTESSLESLKSDTTFLKQAFEHLRLSSVSDTNMGIRPDTGSDLTNKLQMVFRTVQTLLSSVSALQTDMAVLRRNITNISNSSSILDTMLPQLLTTKHFQRTMVDLQHYSRHQSYSSGGSVHATSNVIIETLPQDCGEVQGNKSGVYRIRPPMASAPFFVYCDLESSGGGWTVIQRRIDGTLDFYKNWQDYKHGFGNIGREFWLGLEKIHLLTNYKVNEIYIELEDFTFTKTYAHYSAFSVGNEIEGYPISFLENYEGTAGDSLVYHAGQKFSTFDMDHDNWAEGNCAQSHSGAWWYNGCDTSNLNGRYLNGEVPDQYQYQGMYWYEWRGPKYSLKETKIMIRPAKNLEINFTKSASSSNAEFDEDYVASIFGTP